MHQRLTGRRLQVQVFLLSLSGRDAGTRKARAPGDPSMAELRDASSDWSAQARLWRQMTQESDDSEDAGLRADSAMVHIPLASGLMSSFVFFCEERDYNISLTFLEASTWRWYSSDTLKRLGNKTLEGCSSHLRCLLGRCHKLASSMFCIQDILHNSEGRGEWGLCWAQAQGLSADHGHPFFLWN